MNDSRESTGHDLPEEPFAAPQEVDIQEPMSLRLIVKRFKVLILEGLALLGACLLLMTVGTGTAGWYTSRSQFCNSCHIMEPYYVSWQESSHKDVACIKCHFPPGVAEKVRGKVLGLLQLAKYVTQTQGPRPSAEIPDASCLRVGLPRDAIAVGPGRFQGDRLRPRQALWGVDARHRIALHQLPQPDRAGGAHDGDPVDLFPLPLQGRTFQRGAGRLHTLPSDSGSRVRSWAVGSSSTTIWPTSKVSIARVATPT